MIFTSRIGFDYAQEYLETFKTFNALRDEENDEVYGTCTVLDAKKAIDLAQSAFVEYKRSSPTVRRNFLHGIADELNGERERLIAMYCKESNLSNTRANSELDRTIFQLRSYGDYLLNDNWDRPIESAVPNSSMKISTRLHAIGPVVVFGASNFPFAYSTAGGDTASALAAGCPVIVKAHEMHAGTSFLVGECIIKVAQLLGLPNGVFSHLLDNKYDVGTELVTNVGVKAVGFTGSIKGGRSLMDISARRQDPIPVFAEMGSINPVVLFPSELIKNLELWVDKFTASISNDGGQFCTKPGLFFVPKTEEGEQFIEELKLNLSRQDPKCHLHPNLFYSFKQQVEQVFEWIPVDKKYHSQPVLRVVAAQDYLNNYNYYEEYFGPQAIAVQYQDEEELVNMYRKLDGQLTATFIGSTEEVEEFPALMDQALNRAGRIIYNGVSTGVSVVDAMVHGGAYPAASDSRFTAVGTQCIYRFLRPIAIQSSTN